MKSERRLKGSLSSGRSGPPRSALSAAGAWSLLPLGSLVAALALDATPALGEDAAVREMTASAFEEAVARLEAATDPRRREEGLSRLVRWAEAEGAPLVLGPTRVAFVYRGKAERVRVLGDSTNWSSHHELRRVGDTDFFYAVVELPVAARIEYLISVDDKTMHDPWCRYKTPSGLGGASELAMPDYEHHPIFSEEVRRGREGGYERVERRTIFSKALGYEKEIHVYRPPGADESLRCPTVYFHDGRDYIEYAHTPALLDYLISEGTAPPLNAVFISPPNRHRPEMPNRVTEYGLNPDYVTFVADELIPFLDARFPTVARRDARLTVGDSYAGLVSAYLAHARPDTIGLAYSQSGYLSCKADELIEAYREKPAQRLRLYVDTGVFERTVGKGWLPDAEIDFLAANRRFRETLGEAGYDFVYREYPEGHTWGNWRRHVADALIHFFGDDLGARTDP